MMKSILSYSSVRYILVHNKKLALLYYAVALAIALYVIIYSVIIHHGYQSTESIIAGVSVKVKGSAVGTDGEVYDSYDLVQPALETSGLLITTRLVETLGQNRSVCEGDDDATENCTRTGCINGTQTVNGEVVGGCGPNGFCMLRAWCPLEDDDRGVLFSNVTAWSVFVKINVEFSQSLQTISNFKTGLVRGVNLFYVGDLLSSAGVTYSDIQDKGVILLVSVQYACNLDVNVSDCLPTIQIDRIDGDSFSTGFNFRYIYKSPDESGKKPIRSIYKAAGIRVLFQVGGTGAKFNFAALTTTLGAGLGLLGLATLICDLVLQYFLPQKEREECVKGKWEVLSDDPKGLAFLSGDEQSSAPTAKRN